MTMGVKQSRRAFGLLAACASAGCFYPGPRISDYSFDLRNSTDESFSVELLKIESREVRRVTVDLAPGASYSERFTTDGYAGDYVEARIAPAGSGPDAARQIVELKRGQTKYELERREGRIEARRPARDGQ